MAPDRPESKRLRWFLIGATAVLAVMVMLLIGFGYSLRSQLNEQQQSVRVAETAACFAAARGRPRLIRVLTSISGLLDADKTGRDTVNGLIDDYRASTPLVSDCIGLAENYGLDPKDFPPSTPRGEEGK